MRLDASMPANQLDAAIVRAVSLGTVTAWESSVAKFTAEARHNPFAPHYFAERYNYELAMAQVRRFRRSAGRVPDVARADGDTHRLYSFAAMLSIVYDRLPKAGRKSLSGRVQGALRDDTGLGPLAFEFLIASHLTQKGWDVEWRDWDGGGYDFLVRRGSAEMEVECKAFSADLGRKVHRQHHYQLGGLLGGDIGSALDKYGSIFVDTVIPGRLDTAIDAVAGVIKTVLRSGADAEGPDPAVVRLHKLARDDLPFDPDSDDLNASDISSLAERQFDCVNPSMLVMARRGRGIAIFSIRSAKRDDLVGGMYKQLKHGSTQFSGTRPAILCAHLLDMRPAEIMSLHAEQEKGNHTGLNLIATRLFNGNRPYLHTLQFTAPGLPHKTQTIAGNTRRRHYMESGAAFIFANPKHPEAQNPAFSITS
jgi:hypothetical protein